MINSDISRRTLVKRGAIASAGLGALRLAAPVYAVQTPVGADVIPWLDQPEPNPVPDVIVRQLEWEQLDQWTTPIDQFFVIEHFNEPQLVEADWSLALSGLVNTPMTLSLADIKARPREEVTFTIECSGNTGLPFFHGGVGNATWAGTPLAPLLEEAGIMEEGIEVVFWGADAGEQTWGDATITEHFARSMSLEDAMNPANLLAYEMNGEELPNLNGYPLRLIAPGWYGVANVKWLTRIEVRDSRYQGHFMARDYVTMREEQIDDEAVWTRMLVAHDRLKSAPAKVVREGNGYSVMGAAWGAPIAKVEICIDGGEWEETTLTEGEGEEHAWVFWTYDWASAAPGEHTVSSRATDIDGNVQPAPDEGHLAGKTTYWESNGQITRRVELM